MPKTEQLRDLPCIALIADMVKSRELTREERADVQERFSEFIHDLNGKYRHAILARFVITLGDEFQGLLSDPSVVPDLMWDLHYKFQTRPLRVGVGFGLIDTPIGRNAINIDGPALHQARNAIDLAKREKLLGGVFSGFGETYDSAFNGFARLLQHHRSRLKRQQRRVIELLRQSRMQIAIARELGVSRQAVSLYARAAGWEAYHEGENGWRSLLAEISSSMTSSK